MPETAAAEAAAAEATVYCVLLRRPGTLSRAQFLSTWLVEHRALAERLPGLREVRLLPVAEPPGAEFAGAEFDRAESDRAEFDWAEFDWAESDRAEFDRAEFDGVGLLFFDSRAALDGALASEAAAALRAHTATFAQSDAAIRLLLCEPDPTRDVG
jgi:hypothetical protein